MTASNYPACLAFTLRWEGGWSNHPEDPGGATMKGVTQRRYDVYRRERGLPLRSVRHIEDKELQEIYRKGYWNVVGGDNLPAGVDLAVWDYGVNSGPARAKRVYASIPRGTPRQQVQAVCRQRLGFVQGLRTWRTFGKGWGRRIAQCEALGVRMALAAAMVSQPAAVEDLRKESDAASTAAKTSGDQMKQAGGAAGAGGVAGTGLSPVLNWEWIAVGALGVALLALLAFFAWRSARNERERAEAFAEAARAEAAGIEPAFGPEGVQP